MESLTSASSFIGYSLFGERFALLSKITNEPALQSRTNTGSTPKENARVRTGEMRTSVQFAAVHNSKDRERPMCSPGADEPVPHGQLHSVIFHSSYEEQNVRIRISVIISKTCSE